MEPDITDEQLVAFLDNELEKEARQEIENLLRVDVALAERLDKLRFPTDLLRAQADTELSAAPIIPADLAASLQDDSHGKPERSRMWLPGAIAASLFVGLLAGWLLNDLQGTGQEGEKWVKAIADYQELYVEETLAGVSQSPHEAQARMNTFSNQYNISLAGVKSTDDLTLKRVQMLGFEGRPLLQITFVDKAGTPVALCLVAVQQDDRATSFKPYAGMTGGSWIKNGMGYFVVGRVDQKILGSAIESWQL